MQVLEDALEVAGLLRIEPGRIHRGVAGPAMTLVPLPGPLRRQVPPGFLQHRPAGLKGRLARTPGSAGSIDHRNYYFIFQIAARMKYLYLFVLLNNIKGKYLN